ncbi:MAG: hypothetical protein HY000_33255, partial [Planctomycetes bacterium]|nr:hypothetical protein [Planctomycetota bacterium]
MNASAHVRCRDVRTRFLLPATFLLLFPAVPLRAEPQDRQVAEWVLLLGGSVGLEGQTERVRDVTRLPSGDFRLELVDLVGTNILPPDLQWLSGLTRLKILNLPGPMWNPSSGATIDYSRDLRHIAGIRTLEELTFSYTYLESIKFDDDGIEEIAALGPSLRVLSLENTQVRGRHLAPFTNLEALDLVYCPVNDEGLKQMQGMTRLQKLLIRDAVISDAGVQNLSGLVNLEQLDLGGTKITDAGVAHLRGMTRLKKLNLESAGLTDEGLAVLSVMTTMQELNLYGTRITNAAVDTLENMKDLRTVDLRYTRMTRAGVDRLQAALPRCDITFLDSSVPPTIPAGADRIVAGEGHAQVAEWVRAIGGRAVIEEGQLQEVSLASTSVTDELLRNLQGLKHLRKLELHTTEVGDPGVEHLAGLTGLTELDLSGTAISDAGLAHLAELTGLRKLGLTHTQIAGPGLKHLAAIPLEELRLSSSPVNDEGLAQIG